MGPAKSIAVFNVDARPRMTFIRGYFIARNRSGMGAHTGAQMSAHNGAQKFEIADY